jgi:hypothetical protein
MNSENNMGRSTVIDLNAPIYNNFRQVDHRTIEYIIYKNVKYSLGKKSAGIEELPIKYDGKEPKWNESKLMVGDWFSSVSYYKIKSITDKDNVQVVTPQASTAELTMSRDILNYEMNSAKLYNTEEKVSRTDLVNLLTHAKDCAFTVKFHKKVDKAYVRQILQNRSAKFNKKTLAKEIAHG